MSRPYLHTAEHDMWDQGGYCNALVTDEDGCGDVCGYQRPVLRPAGVLPLPPGHFMGEPVPQVSPNRYEIADALLIAKGYQEVEWLEHALHAEMARTGAFVSVWRDPLRYVTIVEVHAP